MKEIAWIWSHHLHVKCKFKLLAGKFTLGNNAKHCRVMSTNFLFSKVCWQRPAMFFLYTSSKFSCPEFEFFQTTFWNIFYFKISKKLYKIIWILIFQNLGLAHHFVLHLAQVHRYNNLWLLASNHHNRTTNLLIHQENSYSNGLPLI